jgi:single-strand DNA-binding protein
MNGIACAFQGTLGGDAELRCTATGKAVLNLRVAVTDNRPGSDGAEPCWMRVSCWEEVAERLADTLKKGREVYIEGRLKVTTWTAADGTERHGLRVSAWTVQPLGAIGRQAPRRSNATGGGPPPAPSR